MKPSLPKEIKILSLAFLLIFLGFNGVQQFVTTFFSESKIIDVGFDSLILIYLFFVLSNPLAAVFVSKYGAKKSMILASIFYSVFIFSLISKSVALIYFASILLGTAASFLWTGQNSYLIRASDEKTRGASSGFFNSFQSLGSVLGILILSFLIAKFSFNLSFLFFAIFPLIGFLLLSKLIDLRGEQNVNRFKLIKKSITSITALQFSIIWFSWSFIFGLIIGIIPVEIKNNLGMAYVGILSSLFYIIPILFSYIFGKFSDIKGRKPMIILSYIVCLLGLIALYFSNGAVLLVMGIILIAMNYAIIRPISLALVGDVATKDNLEFLAALFWMAQNVGIISALLLSRMFKTDVQIIYAISIFVIGISILILFPLLRLKIEKIKEKISQEMI